MDTRSESETETLTPKDNMEEKSEDGAERNEAQLGHHTANGWRHAETAGFHHCPKHLRALRALSQYYNITMGDNNF